MNMLTRFNGNKRRPFRSASTPRFVVWAFALVMALLAITVPHPSADAQQPSSGVTVRPVHSLWSRIGRQFVLPPGIAPKPLAIGYPLIQTKGMVKGGDYLYISDTGRDGYYNEAAKIWRLNPRTGELKVFFTGPPLVNSKWLFYRKAKHGMPAMLVVSDYGVEPTFRLPGTGEGAKVFTIPILPDGSPGQATILHEGPPFRSPEGMTVIGETVIVSDWAAGGMGSRPDRPGVTFPTGRLFQFPLSGGVPTALFEDHPWIVLIASCKYFIDGKLYLRVIDIDGGRADRSGLAGMPQSGTPAFYQAEVLSTSPLRLGPLERTFLAEDGPVTLQFSGLMPDDLIRITLKNNDTFDDGLAVRTVPATLLGQRQSFTFMARSDMNQNAVVASVEAVRDANTINVGDITVVKDPPAPSFLAFPGILNNKHAGSTGDDGGDEDEDGV
jgi:hypothetical protein